MQVVLSSEGSIAQAGYLHPTSFHVEPKRTGQCGAHARAQFCGAWAHRSVGGANTQASRLETWRLALPQGTQTIQFAVWQRTRSVWLEVRVQCAESLEGVC